MARSTDLSIFRFYTLWAETGHYPTSKYPSIITPWACRGILFIVTNKAAVERGAELKPLIILNDGKVIWRDKSIG